MPALFAWSPQPNSDLEASPATQSPSRFGALRSNVRTMVNGSSVYSQSPALTNNTNTPKTPFLGFWNRSPNPNEPRPSHNVQQEPGSPPTANHSASSYIGAIQETSEPNTIYARHPADVPLPQADGFADPEIQQLANDINGRRRRRRKHRRRQHPDPQRSGSTSSTGTRGWVRRRNERDTAVRGSAARGKLIACIISGTFLITILAIYLAIALTNTDLGQEIHILFIMVLLTITIFFCHSLIRLCMLILNPPPPTDPNNPAFSLSIANPSDGFQPVVPIRVHLRRDEEAAAADMENDLVDAADPEKDLVPPPPPAYGLWRSSVRVNPDLLHWQRVDGAAASMRGSVMSSNVGGGGGGGARNGSVASRNGSVTGPSVPRSSPLAAGAGSTRGSAAAPGLDHDDDLDMGPRPPSYASEDGVSYILEAEPRSTAPVGDAYSEIHPAWRPGFAISEVRAGEVPQGVART
ncbi:hypothetical protein CFE70_010486 [Pyrenophora teres f. teres 0-1]|uniref:Uncharacterized protein n=2 Tax=Pyrenophora teres f. teres TaxID=97479 RepID=E3RF56_PYRTT|nr:hypothetical protein PTT_05674 [Pyrenophora teres f. teres 0-1]KAE8823032.1 hypothetical protein PTNB85_10211 [Pyrenophora teres f. teres]KAE8823149.1 hypothetical protein HRS9139_09558 [Pyrenophora teres f. teres]KAE8834252.1 hypothetical protein HRS9122_08332 [Pyrenophora teres f. teres]KAE8854324.1 hypothetical protein PTNB29_09680 [Pyrenophora teres f. teres]